MRRDFYWQTLESRGENVESIVCVLRMRAKQEDHAIVESIVITSSVGYTEFRTKLTFLSVRLSGDMPIIGAL